MTDNDLERALARLPEPEPPADFAAAVMSVIAAEEAPVGGASPAPAMATAPPRPAGRASVGAFAIGLAGAGLAAGTMAQRGWTEDAAPLVARLGPALHRLPPLDSLSLLTALGLILLLAATLSPPPARRAG